MGRHSRPSSSGRNRPSRFATGVAHDRGPFPSGEGSSSSSREAAGDTIITSRRNPVIQDVRNLVASSSRRAARCVVEGWRVLETAVASGAEIQLVLCTPAAAADPRARAIQGSLRARKVRLVMVSPYVFESLTQVETPQGVFAVLRRPPEAPSSILRDRRALLAVLDGVQDPGNVGTILRTAAAAGATAAAIVGSTANPFGPKAIRASAGAVFRLPLLHFRYPGEALAALQREGIRILIADPSGEQSDAEASFLRPLALVFGGEGAGTAPAWRPHGSTVRLPMAGEVESLNVAAAAAVLLYAAARVDTTIDA
jgi:RNA methyltransferase, TrmH family